MKVLQINSHFSVGGPPRIMNGIYDTLTENGHVCKIAAAREKQMVPQDSIPIGHPHDVYINVLKARGLDNDGLSAKKATHKFIRDIDAFQPDIIQLHNLHGYYINIEILFNYLKQSGIPVVWTMHDCWAVTGHCPYFTTVKCEKYKSGCYSCPLKKAYPSSLVLDRSERNWILKKSLFADMDNLFLITPSQWLANIIKESYLQNIPVRVIHNGIDLHQFSDTTDKLSSEYNLQNKKIVLGVAQNWAEHKGFEDFIKLAGLLEAQYQVVMIGLTDDQMKILPKSVLGLKRTNSVAELAKWYANAHVFVNMTYQDNFPTVNIEALACGTPVITYDTGGSPEALDEFCGWVVEQGRVELVAQIIGNIDGRGSYQQKALSRSKLFDRKGKYKEYIELYAQLIGDNAVRQEQKVT